MEPGFDSTKISLALRKGKQVRITFCTKGRTTVLGFQAECDSTIRQVYKKSNLDSDVLEIMATRPTINTLVQSLELNEKLQILGYQILPKDWCSFSSSSPLTEIDRPEIATLPLENQEGIQIKDGWVWDRKSDTVFGVMIDKTPRELRPDHLSKFPSEKFYHVAVLGRGLRDPLGKTEFQETLSQLKAKGKKR